MADPLSIGASIAGLVTLADLVFMRLFRYVRSVKNADKDMKSLCTEVNLLSGALSSLDRLASQFDSDSQDSSYRTHQVSECEKILTHLAAKFPDPDENQNSVIKKLKWPLISRKTEEILGELSGIKDNIVFSLQSSSLDGILRCLAKSEGIQVDVRKTLEITTRIEENQRTQQLRDKFLIHNPQRNYQTSLSLRHPHTGLWLEKSPELQTWLTEPQGRLWLTGIPGAGKTVLAGRVIEQALNKCSESICTAFFFCDYKDSVTHQPLTIVGALAFQIAIQSQEAYQHLEEYYDSLNPAKFYRDPTIKDLADVIGEMLDCFEKTFITIDGLDECGSLSTDVLAALFEILDRSEKTSLAILSRDEIDIRASLQSRDPKFSTIQISARTEDIREYASAEIEKRAKEGRLRMNDPSLKDEILEGLVKGPKGMFRWVACQLDNLGNCMSDSECRQALKEFPPDLEGTYLRILEKIPARRKSLVSTALAFILRTGGFSKAHLREALSFSDEESGVSHPARLIHTDVILQSCSSLVRESNDGEKIELAHFTVEEFLRDTKNSALTGDLKQFLLTPTIAEAKVSEQCLRYIQIREFFFKSGSRQEQLDFLIEFLKSHSFYGWAAERWPRVFRDEFEDENKEIPDYQQNYANALALAKSLFDPEKMASLVLWAAAYSLNVKPAKGWYDRNKHYAKVQISCLASRDFTPLHIAAQFGLPQLCAYLLSAGCDVNHTSAWGTPLAAAISVDEPTHVFWEFHRDLFGFGRSSNQAYYGVLQCLIDANASLGPFPELQCSSLMILAFRSVTAVRNFSLPIILLNNGYEIGPDELDGIKAAIAETDPDTFLEDQQTVSDLLDSLELVLEQSPVHRELFREVWELGSLYFPEFLHDSLEACRSGMVSSTPAHAIFTALENGNPDFLGKVFHDPPSDLVNMKNETGETLLEAALKSRDLLYFDEEGSVIRSLLQAGCDPLEKNESGQTPFEMWSQRYAHRSDAWLTASWLEAGIQVPTQYEGGMNSLHLNVHSLSRINCLITSNPTDMVQNALIAVNGEGYTPFTWALEQGELDSAKLLYQARTEAWKAPKSLLSLVVEANADTLWSQLTRDGYGVGAEGYECNPLEHLHAECSLEFVESLKALRLGATSELIEEKYPFEYWVETGLSSSSTWEDKLPIITTLTDPWIQNLDPLSLAKLWERFTCRLASESFDRWGEFAVGVIDYLVQVSALSCYEEISGRCAVLRLIDLDQWSGFQSENVPAVISRVLMQSKKWPTFKTTQNAVCLLVSGARTQNLQLCKLLVENGVSPQDRFSGINALEASIEQGYKRFIDNDARDRTFWFLIQYSSSARLDELSPESGLTLLHSAVRKDNALSLLDKGCSLDIRSKKTGQTALVHHIYLQHWDIVDLLLEKGADPFIADDLGFNAALTFSWVGNERFLDQLIKTHSSLKVLGSVAGRTCHFPLRDSKDSYKVDGSGANALHIASFQNHLDIVKLCVHHQITGGVDGTSKTGWTAMHFAAAEGNLNVIKYLGRDCSAKVNARSHDGDLPLHLAAYYKHLEITKALLDLGSDFSPNHKRMTPLSEALETGNEAVIECIRVAMGLKVTISTQGQQPAELHSIFEEAVRANDLELCKQLHHRGISVDIDLPSCGCCSLLIAALVDSSSDVSTWLLDQGCCTLKRRCDGESAIYEAIKSDICEDILPRLMEIHSAQGGRITSGLTNYLYKGVSTKKHSTIGMILGHAIHQEQNSFEDIVDLINLPIHKWSCLHKAVANGDLEATEALLRRAAQVNTTDADLQTPLFMVRRASEVNATEMIELLVSHGAILEAQDLFNDTALGDAMRSNAGKCRDSFIATGASLRYPYDFKRAIPSPWGLKLSRGVYIKTSEAGFLPRTRNPEGCSIWHAAACHAYMASLLLNSDVDIDQITPFPWHVAFAYSDWLQSTFRLFRRKIASEQLRCIANVNPESGWSPLCRFSCVGDVNGMENVISLGAMLDFEGCYAGSALMVACERGQFKSIKFLVRRGASLFYNGPKGIRSALMVAARHNNIVQWLIAGRFRDQCKLAHSPHPSTSELETRSWSGYESIEMSIGVSDARRKKHSSWDYLIHLEAVKRRWRGRVIPESRMTDYMG